MVDSNEPYPMNMEFAPAPDIAGKILFHEPMSAHTSFKIGGPADIFAIPADVQDLQIIMRWAKARSMPVMIIGAGTNLLVSDKGIRGIVIMFGGGFMSAEIRGRSVVAGCGVRLPALLRRALGAGLSGLEGLAGVPGTVGGAICMNAGTSAGCVKDSLESVRVVDRNGLLSVVDARNLGLTYRGSTLSTSGFTVVEATFALSSEETGGIADIVESLIQRRKATQPVGIHTAGSVFKNPHGEFAGRVLESAGAKGTQVGGARVSGKHANFIENTGTATAEDVRELIRKLQQLSKEKYGITLEPEIQMVGEW
jgi:UDP-N-acetylmuramate dehydrogenase